MIANINIYAQNNYTVYAHLNTFSLRKNKCELDFKKHLDKLLLEEALIR